MNKKLFVCCLGVYGIVSTAINSSSFAANLPFYSTSTTAAWQVATNITGRDGNLPDFPTDGFLAAVAYTMRESDGIKFIANNSTGTNGSIGTWTQFVFRQLFNLSGYDPLTAVLGFQWAADDSGEVVLARGSWTPKYRLNGGNLINGSWATGYTYELGLPTEISSGFLDGINTIDFYVQGNGVTDGFALRSLGLRADLAGPPSAPTVPGPLPFLGVGAAFGFSRQLRKRIKDRKPPIASSIN